MQYRMAIALFRTAHLLDFWKYVWLSKNFCFVGHFIMGLHCAHGRKTPRWQWQHASGKRVANQWLQFCLCPLGMVLPFQLSLQCDLNYGLCRDVPWDYTSCFPLFIVQWALTSLILKTEKRHGWSQTRRLLSGCFNIILPCVNVQVQICSTWSDILDKELEGLSAFSATAAQTIA